MNIFNGAMKMVDNRSATPVSTDVCKIAGGAFYHGDFIYTPWTSKAALLSINYLEVLSLEPAAMRWAHCWTNRKVYVHCYNITACHIINKGSSKNPTVMAALRRIFWLSAIYNFRLYALYYPGPSNSLADWASRLHEPDGLNKLYETIINYWVKVHNRRNKMGISMTSLGLVGATDTQRKIRIPNITWNMAHQMLFTLPCPSNHVLVIKVQLTLQQ